MYETMGQVIKRLRKEKNFTQEELAEQLGVTFQAVSKWENGSGMPDISQIVPLATVFGVSTDTLFGMHGADNAEEVQKIIEDARARITDPATTESVRYCYRVLTDALNKYPNNTALLLQCLETGISLAYPENDIYDIENGKSIYLESIRQADLIIKYGNNTTDILRAHMIMVLLHSAYGNTEAAKKHAIQFPIRADMTAHKTNAYIAHFEKDYKKENKNLQYDCMYHLEALLDDIVKLGLCYYRLENYKDAQEVLSDALRLIEIVCRKEDTMPSLHYRESGDIYALLAEVYLKDRNIDNALQTLQKMVNHDLCVCTKYKSSIKMHTPLLRDTDNVYYHTRPNIKGKLLNKLNNPVFDELRENNDFCKLLKYVNSN